MGKTTSWRCRAACRPRPGPSGGGPGLLSPVRCLHRPTLQPLRKVPDARRTNIAEKVAHEVAEKGAARCDDVVDEKGRGAGGRAISSCVVARERHPHRLARGDCKSTYDAPHETAARGTTWPRTRGPRSLHVHRRPRGEPQREGRRLSARHFGGHGGSFRG